MKNLLSRIGGFVILLVLLGSITLFAYGMQRRSLPSSAMSQTQSRGYPEPRIASDDAVQNSYPAPVALNESLNQESCSEFGTWEVYSDKVAGYSLKYPAESDFRESSGADENYSSVSIYLKPSCYDQQCGGSNRVIISRMRNPNKLLVAEFVEQEFQLLISSSHANSSQNLQTSRGEVIEVAGTQGLRIENEETFNQPNIFIPHGDSVIRVYISAASPVPPHDFPCKQTLKLLDGILKSIELLPPTAK